MLYVKMSRHQVYEFAFVRQHFIFPAEAVVTAGIPNAICVGLSPFVSNWNARTRYDAVQPIPVAAYNKRNTKNKSSGGE